MLTHHYEAERGKEGSWPRSPVLPHSHSSTDPYPLPLPPPRVSEISPSMQHSFLPLTHYASFIYSFIQHLFTECILAQGVVLGIEDACNCT
jgi:hypothetical protein